MESRPTVKLSFPFDIWASQMVPVVKNLPVSAGDAKRHRFNPWVGNIPLEKEMATHSSSLAWKIPWTEEPAGLQSQRAGHNWARTFDPKIDLKQV